MNTKNKIILLAEDDQDDITLFEEALCIIDPSLVLFTSENGCEALNRLGSRGFSPDVIFLDIHMPIMNGIDCLKKIKASESYKYIPVIMYSTSIGLDLAAECLNNGAVDFIQKSFNITEISYDIKNTLSKLP